MSMFRKKQKPMTAEVANQHRFLKAKESASEDEMVCGYYVEGVPHYFTMPKDATDEEVRDETFRRMHGRGYSSLERKLIDIYDSHEDFDWDGKHAIT
jgi:Mor family transcriptional regulator